MEKDAGLTCTFRNAVLYGVRIDLEGQGQNRAASFIYETITRHRVVRGGAVAKQEACMDAAYRDAHGSLNLGFRCVRPA